MTPDAQRRACFLLISQVAIGCRTQFREHPDTHFGTGLAFLFNDRVSPMQKAQPTMHHLPSFSFLGSAAGPQIPILVIDDDPSILATVSEILEEEGYSVVTATNGLEGLRAIERLRPAVILLDMRMPVLDGWGFARKLKERGIKLPILVITAAQDAGRWATEVGANGYLAKPFDLLELVTAVENLAQAA
jgi:CheY-like chemotaxis protein